MTKFAAGCALLGAAFLGGCASDPPPPEPYLQPVVKNAGGISYEFWNYELQRLGDKASTHCADYGKLASLRDVKALPSGNQLASFDCN